MTACVVVLSRYIPNLAVFDRLLSERPALQSHLWLYQRLLARDEDEAEDIIEDHRENHSRAETCDQLLLGTLLALKRDLAAGRILREDGDFVASALREIIDDLRGESDANDGSEAGEGPRVLLIGFPVRDKLDEIALELLGAMLREEPCKLEILSPEMLVGERIAEVVARRPAAVCIPSLPPGDLTATRHACKRLRARVPGLPVIVGRLSASKSPARSQDLLRAAGARHVAVSLEELRDFLRPVVRDARRALTTDEPVTDTELAAVQ